MAAVKNKRKKNGKEKNGGLGNRDRERIVKNLGRGWGRGCGRGI